MEQAESTMRGVAIEETPYICYLPFLFTISAVTLVTPDREILGRRFCDTILLSYELGLDIARVKPAEMGVVNLVSEPGTRRSHPATSRRP